MKKVIIALFVMLTCAHANIASADIEKVRDAYNKQDYETVLERIQPLLEQGNAQAENLLGVMYEKGQGVHQNQVKAIAMYRKAAAKGDARAQTNLAVSYENGRGVIRSYQKALSYYKKAAEQNYSIAQESLGYFYLHGIVVKKDFSKAEIWFRKAANQGDPQAQYDLGLMYREGKGLTKDAAQAFEWFNKAAQQGLLDAQIMLGSLYASGQGVPVNNSSALTWYHKAIVQGSKVALKEYYEVAIKTINQRQADNENAVDTRKDTPVKATAKISDPFVDGALVCQSYDDMQMMIHIYHNYTELSIRASIIGKEQDRLIHGKIATPKPEQYGCVLLPAGTLMLWDGSGYPAVIIAKVSNGEVIRGVTDHSMIKVGKECRTRLDCSEVQSGISNTCRYLETCE